MGFSTDKIASEFLELASEQRISIIPNLEESNYTISQMAKKLDANNCPSNLITRSYWLFNHSK